MESNGTEISPANMQRALYTSSASDSNTGNGVDQQSYSPARSDVDYDYADDELDSQSQEINNTSGQQYHNNGGGGGGGGGAYQDQHRDSPVMQNGTTKILSTTVSGQNQQIGSPAASWGNTTTHGSQSNDDQNNQHHQQSQQNNVPPGNALGMLRFENQVLYITEPCTEIGRNSSTSWVHFHVARNSFVSRKHLKLLFNEQSLDFYLICLSKNGVFIDNMFQRRSTEATKLPRDGCTFRFPSTDIRIVFENFAHKIQSDSAGGGVDTVRGTFKTVENSNVILSPLKITIPKVEQKSPYPSPTGTISAANSCTTSPRGYQEYPSYNYNNNNHFQNGPPPPPPAASNNEHEKPPYSYAQLIVQSISAAPDKQLTLSGIYSFISKHYPYYRKEANKGWQNSIRHNLSLNRYFIKVARSQDEPGKGSFWRIDPSSEAKLIDQSYKKRRQRGSQCFRPPYMPRSAPVSPSHIDNSRDNSPLRDIVLQSAPGSPGGGSYQNSSHVESHCGNEDNYNNPQQTIKSYPTIFGSSSSSNYYTNNQPGQSTSATLKRHKSSTPSTTTTAVIANHHSAVNIANITYFDEEIVGRDSGDSADECDGDPAKRMKYETDDMNQ